MAEMLEREPNQNERLAFELRERFKELNCLYEVSALLSDESRTVSQRMQAVADRLPAGWQHPEIAAACVRVDNREFRSAGWKGARHAQKAPIRVDGSAVGEVEVIYTADPPENPEQVFLREEDLLIGEIARRLADFFRSEWRLQRAAFLEEQLRPRPAPEAPRTPPSGPQGLVGDSGPMRELYRSIAKACQTDATVLIKGESGTGKELVARAVHYGSARSDAAFVPVNCAAIPESLVESELFGYVKGAFTGAHTTRAGFFQTADGGTIFLDEIGEMNAVVQAKLLRVVQDHEIRMVGSDRIRSTDIRILAATHHDLASLVESGRFRADLFFRLNVLVLHVPPLRDRGGDIQLLIDHFNTRYTQQTGGEPLAFSERAIRTLEHYSWPGNVRELGNLVQQLTVMAEDRYVDVDDLPAPMRFTSESKRGSLRSLDQVESEHIERVLNAVGGNRSRAARILGIDRKTLRNKLDSMRGA